MSTDGSESVTRRGFMRAATGTAAAAGAAGTAAAESEETTTGGDGGGGATEEVIVGPGGSLVFEPAEIEIPPGTTVHWVWESDNHNIVVESAPEDASWEGTPGPPSKTYNTGYEYSHTFETTGTYEYFCQPHKVAGMVGTVVVAEGAGQEGGGGGPAIPSSAKTLGIATTAAMVFTLGLAYFFMKYGGDYHTSEE